MSQGLLCTFLPVRLYLLIPFLVGIYKHFFVPLGLKESQLELVLDCPLSPMLTVNHRLNPDVKRQEALLLAECMHLCKSSTPLQFKWNSNRMNSPFSKSLLKSWTTAGPCNLPYVVYSVLVCPKKDKKKKLSKTQQDSSSVKTLSSWQG